MSKQVWTSGFVALITSSVGVAHAQEPGRAADAPVTAPAVNTPQSGVYAPPPRAGFDPNAGLSQSARARGPGETDTFDFQRGDASSVVRGREGASGVGGRAMRVPDVHTVERGDTLWTLCDRFYGDPYQWPRVWSYNPQLQNPHWIYPGDELRLRGGGDLTTGEAVVGSRMSLRRAMVPRNTVFLRDSGFIDDYQKDVWGEIVGSREEQMMLSAGNFVYVQVKKGVDVEVGSELTIFKPLRKPERVNGARRPPGEIVKVLGTVKVDQWDEKRRIARGRISESIDVIERGNLVGSVGRKFDVVPPRKATTTLWARVLTSLYPNVYVAQNQIVFIDRGSDDGVEPGNRLFVVRRGDTWRRSLRAASGMARDRLRMDDPNRVSTERTPTNGDEDTFPEEIVGELRVLRTRKRSSVAIVTVSHRELEAGDRAALRKGY